MTKISIIIPVYNAENHLAKMFETIRCQTYQNLEIICVNDGSTDNSLEVLQSYSEKDDRFIIKTIQNSGASAARNAGLEIATGDYVSFLDSDDWINLTLYDSFVQSYSISPVDIWFFNLGFCFKDTPFVIPKISTQILDWNDWDYEKVLTFDNCRNPMGVSDSVANKIYRRQFLEENNFRFLEGAIFEDSLFNFQTLLAAKSLKVNFEVFYWYNQENAGSVTKNYGLKIFDIFKILREINACFDTPELYENYKYALFQYNFVKLFELYSKTDKSLRSEFYDRMSDLFNSLDLSTLDLMICKQLKRYNDYMAFLKLNNKDAFYDYLVKCN